MSEEPKTFPLRTADEAALRDFLNGSAPALPLSAYFGGDHWGPEACRLIALSRPEFVFDALRFYGTRIGDDGLDWLTGGLLTRMTSLRSLSAERSDITDASLQRLAFSAPLKNLRYLNLSNPTNAKTGEPNRIGDAGAAALGRSPYLESLEELDLWLTDVGDDGFLALVSSAGLPRLRSLDANVEGLTAAGAERAKAAARRKWEQSGAGQLWKDSHGAQGLYEPCSVSTPFDDRLITYMEW